MLKSMRKNGLTLALFALGCTAMVVLTNELTRDRIAHQQELEKLRTLQALLPEGSYDNDLVASCKQVTSRKYLGSDQPQALYTASKNDVVTGYALEAIAPDGYSGAIRIVAGFDAKGTITAVRGASRLPWKSFRPITPTVTGAGPAAPMRGPPAHAASSGSRTRLGTIRAIRRGSWFMGSS